MTSPVEYSFRPGTPDDVAAMALVTEYTNADRAAQPLPDEIPVDSRDYQHLTERSGYVGFWSHVALAGDTVVGFVAGYPGELKSDDETDAEYLWLLMVDPRQQGRGIGRALLGLAADTARQRGAESIFLQTAEADNQAARGLYESVEYLAVGMAESSNRGTTVKYRLSV